MSLQVSQNFILEEFICPEIYHSWGESSIWFLDDRIITIAQFMRTRLGVPCTINNWHNGGQYKESGLRYFGTTTGAKFGDHLFGRAIDAKFKDTSPAQVHQFIKDNWAALSLLGLTTIENLEFTPTWTHLSTRNWGDHKLHIVNP